MGNTAKIRELLAQLEAEFENLGDAEPDVQRKMQELQREIAALESSDASTETVVDQVKEIESRFAASHPRLEQAARELLDALGKMGI